MFKLFKGLLHIIFLCAKYVRYAYKIISLAATLMFIIALTLGFAFKLSKVEL